MSGAEWINQDWLKTGFEPEEPGAEWIQELPRMQLEETASAWHEHPVDGYLAHELSSNCWCNPLESTEAGGKPVWTHYKESE